MGAATAMSGHSFPVSSFHWGVSSTGGAWLGSLLSPEPVRPSMWPVYGAPAKFSGLRKEQMSK